MEQHIIHGIYKNGVINKSSEENFLCDVYSQNNGSSHSQESIDFIRACVVEEL